MSRASHVFELLEPRRLRAAGDLDPLFGDDGITDDIRDHYTMAFDAVLLSGDKVLIAGETGDSNGGPRDFLLRRYNADGSLDTTFGQGGEVTGDLGFDRSAIIYKLAAAPGGKFVAVVYDQGGVGASEVDQYQLARFNGDGSLDTSFSGDGFVIAPAAYADSQLVVQDDGKIVVAAAAHAVARYNADGTLDTTFGSGGTITLPSNRQIRSVRLLSGGAGGLLVAAYDDDDLDDRTSPTTYRLAKFTAAGAPDASFVPDFSSSAIADDVLILPDGRLVVSAHTDAGIELRRLAANGALDTTFGDNGVARDPFHLGARRLLRDASGRIYATGGNFGGAAMRFSADGVLDESFGRVFGMGDPSGFYEGPASFLQSNGQRLVFAGGHQGHFVQGVTLVGRLIEDDGEASPITLSGGVASVAGTSGRDFVFAEDFASGSTVLAASLNGVGRAFPVADVDLLSVAAGAGDDIVELVNIHLVPCLVSGGDGADKIAGSLGRDTLNGNAGNDRIDGHTGGDLLNGNGGNDRLDGLGGHDRLRGGAGDDGLVGGFGNDRLDGGSGADVLRGGAGDDLFFNAPDGAVDSLFDDSGANRVEGDGDADDLVQLATGT